MNINSLNCTVRSLSTSNEAVTIEHICKMIIDTLLYNQFPWLKIQNSDQLNAM